MERRSVELSDRSLEAELATIAERAEPGRTAGIAVRHWGWDGRGGATLGATGREFGGITRERVRQLCERLVTRIRAGAELDETCAVRAPALERALLVAAGVAPTTARDLARLLADERVSARPFDPAGLLTAADVLGHEAPFLLDTVKDVRVVLPNPPDPTADSADVIATILDTARAIVRRAGAARVSDVTGRVAAGLAVWVDDGLVTALVTEAKDFVWLERRTGWFFLPSVAKNAVVSRVVKILSVAGDVGLDELHAGIRRDERMKEFVMPEYILAELCERIPGLSVAGGRVRAVKSISPEEVLETTELTLVRVLTRNGGTMERRELERLCVAAGIKPSSFNNRIAYSPIIAERGYGRYAIRGTAGEGTGWIGAVGATRTGADGTVPPAAASWSSASSTSRNAAAGADRPAGADRSGAVDPVPGHTSWSAGDVPWPGDPDRVRAQRRR